MTVNELGTPAWAPVPSWIAYGCVRQNLTVLLRDRDGAGELRVPACPDWNVRDVIAHLVGFCRSAEANLALGRAGPPAPAGDLFTLGLPALLAEWDRSGSQVETSLARPEHLHRGAVMVMDAFTHELDITYALGSPLPAEHPAYPGALEVAVGGLTGSIMSLGLPALRLETSGAAWTAGDGRPAAVVRAARLDLYRSITGRRTHQQIRQLGWTADPGPWLPAFAWGSFQPPVQPSE
jgi:uncharacterized protein (TIGR03083 family)